jgi:hypothetical protein
MILTIKENQKHKHIKVRARACSDCGKKSEWVEKTFFVDCDKVNLQVIPKGKTIINQRIDGISSILPCVTVANNEPCLVYFYEMSETDFIEVTTKSRISKGNRLEDVAKNLDVNQKILYLSVRAFCTKSETWKSEQVNIFYEVEKEFIYTPSVYNSTSDNNFIGYLQKSDFVRLCIPSVAEGTKIKYTLDGTNPKQAQGEYGEVIGDYIEVPITFDTIGDFTIRAVSTINGKYSKEKKQVVKVRDYQAISGDTESVVSVDGENDFILGAIEGVDNG